MRAALAAVAVLGALVGCTGQEPSPAAQPTADLCPAGTTAPACTSAVIGEMRTRLAELSGGGPLDTEGYAAAVGGVLGSERIALGHGYQLLSGTGDGPSSEPVQFRFDVAGTSSTWWACLPEPVVQPRECGT